ncbi:MAG: hypothetical protein KGH89_01595 [Thaumarchaeota archaeon]|nr:hypothetical protein [Nitrososphaerota archaeon]
MTTETLERNQSLDILCKQVSSIDNHIELVAILNRKGRVVEMIAKDDGVNRDLPAQKREMLFMEFVLQASMNTEYDNEFGKVKGLILQREKISAFSFQIYDHVLVVITRPMFEPIVVQQRITEIIFNHAKLELTVNY